MQNNLEYIAGFFDGEGSITIQKRTRAYWFRLFVSLASNDKPSIDLFRDRWNGDLTEMPPGIRQPHAKTGPRIATATSYRLIFDYDEAEAFLVDILPHLRIKQKQAELALKFLDAYKSLSSLRSAGRPYTGIEVETYTRLYNEMKRLNS